MFLYIYYIGAKPSIFIEMKRKYKISESYPNEMHASYENIRDKKV
jgi:hypothetical protein